MTSIQQIIAAKIAAEQAKPFTHSVVTTYANGDARIHDTRSYDAACNYAIGEGRKIGRDLICRNTGKTVRVVHVGIVEA